MLFTRLFFIGFVESCLFVLVYLAEELQPGDEGYHPGPQFIDETTRWSACLPVNQTIYDFTVETLDDKSTTLEKYKGDPLLIINVATFCAYTQQYNDFNPLLQKNEKYGLKIAAFPCNQFNLQEPAENHEILNGIQYVRPGNDFRLHKNLQVYGKLEVNGKNHHPLYEFLKESCPQTIIQIGHRNELMYDPIKVNDITWNFEKFLIDHDGRPRYRFHPTAWSHGDILRQFIENLAAENITKS